MASPVHFEILRIPVENGTHCTRNLSRRRNINSPKNFALLSPFSETVVLSYVHIILGFESPPPLNADNTGIFRFLLFNWFPMGRPRSLLFYSDPLGPDNEPINQQPGGLPPLRASVRWPFSSASRWTEKKYILAIGCPWWREKRCFEDYPRMVLGSGLWFLSCGFFFLPADLILNRVVAACVIIIIWFRAIVLFFWYPIEYGKSSAIFCFSLWKW